ncbi:MAG: AraC family transcriptional regulator [Pseudomonadota bacterium]
MQAQPTISSAVVRSLCEAMAEHQGLVKHALRRFGLISVLEDLNYHRVPLHRYLKMFEWLAEELDSPNLGLELSDRTGAETIGAVGYLFLSSANLEMAFRSLARNIHAIQDVSRLDLTVGKRYVLVRYRVAHPRLDECRQDNEYSLAFMWRLVQLYTGNRCPLVQVDFEHQRPEDIQPHRRFFNAPVLFNQPNNNLYLPRSAMQITSTALDSGLFSILEAQLSETAAKQSQPQTFADRVLDQLTDEVLRDGARARVIAARLGVSEPTLHRRLRAEGRTCKKLVEEHCKLLARRMISQESLPVATIARRLGYAETACLTRAFKRWFGVTPRDYRQQLAGRADAASAG